MGDDVEALIKAGKLGSRGLHSQAELDTLIAIIKRGGETKAEEQLVQLMNKDLPSPSLAPSAICFAVTDPVRGCLDVLLDASTKGELELHTEIKKTEIEQGEMIGKGKAGRVYMGTYLGKTVAIKQFNNPEKLDDREFRKELAIMSVVREPAKVLPCFGGSTKKGHKFIVTELMVTSVYDVIHASEVELDERLRLIMARQIARDMQYLHSRNIIHRDLKSLNLLINTQFEIKICDFGLSRVIDKNQPMTSNIGTVAWIAPEIFSNKKLYTEKADVYSFGVIMWELLTRQMPFAEAEAFTIPVLVTKGKRPTMPKKVPKDYGKLLEKCWHQKGEKRPSFDDICTRLDEQWDELMKTKGTKGGYHLEKRGDRIELKQIDEAEAEKRKYPAHCLFGPKQ